MRWIDTNYSCRFSVRQIMISTNSFSGKGRTKKTNGAGGGRAPPNPNSKILIENPGDPGNPVYTEKLRNSASKMDWANSQFDKLLYHHILYLFFLI